MTTVDPNHFVKQAFYGRQHGVIYTWPDMFPPYQEEGVTYLCQLVDVTAKVQDLYNSSGSYYFADIDVNTANLLPNQADPAWGETKSLLLRTSDGSALRVGGENTVMRIYKP